MSNIKDIRKQIKNVVQELLSDVLLAEVSKQVEKKVEDRVKKLEEDTKESMRLMNERHKDVMGYLVRQVTTSTPASAVKEGQK